MQRKIKEFWGDSKQNKVMLIGILTLALAVILGCLCTFTDLGRVVRNEPKVIEGKVKVIGEFESLSDIKDIDIEREISNEISKGTTGVISSNGRAFVVLSSGAESVQDIVYEVTNDLDGNTVIKYGFSGEASVPMVRYKVIEVDGIGSIDIVQSKIVSDNSSPFISQCIAVREEDGTYRVYSNELGSIENDLKLNMGSGLYSVVLRQSKDGKVEAREFKKTAVMGIDAKVIEYNSLTGIAKLKIGDFEIEALSDKYKLEVDSEYKFYIRYDNGFKVDKQ